MEKLTHPDKVLFPADGITKADLAAYYDAIAPLILPQLRDRPVTMERYPSGIGHKGFVQKDVSRGFPAWLERVEAPKRGGVVHYPLIEDRRGLAWLANQNCITPHVWTSRAPHLYQPDLCVFDLDPSTDDSRALQQAALAVRDMLAEAGLRSWVKTSGSKGFHIVVPLDGEDGFEEVMALADAVGRQLVERHPCQLTLEFLKADREGRIFVDIGRNEYSATFACAYAVRARAGAPVSAPCTWDELAEGRVEPTSFGLRSMLERVAQVGDVWADLYQQPQSATRALAHLGGPPEGPSPARRRFR
jgi:bifunctional non-homologous end joining protein LigD